MIDSKCKYLKSGDVSNFFLNVAIYINFGSLGYNNVIFSRESIPIDEARKKRVQKSFFEIISQEIKENPPMYE
jgi:hypothetical protein